MRAHGDLGGRVLLPIHWATFNLAFHRWAEPAQRVVAAAERVGARVVVPLPGERIDVLDPPELRDWWTEVGASTDHDEHRRDAGVGSAVLARTLSRLLALARLSRAGARAARGARPRRSAASVREIVDYQPFGDSTSVRMESAKGRCT